MSEIVDEFRALRDAINKSALDHRWVQPCIAMVRTLQGGISWRHHRAHALLRQAVLALVTRPGGAAHALERLDALEQDVLQGTGEAAPSAPVVLRRLGHLELIQGGRAA